MSSPLAFGSLRGRSAGLVFALGFAAIAAHAQYATKLPTTSVAIGGETFTLEVARDPAVQYRGLGGRTHIDPHGGMLFVFPSPRATAFVMRDCPIPIDVAFLDASGRVIALHEMPPEPARRADESADCLRVAARAVPEWAARAVRDRNGGRTVAPARREAVAT